MHRTLGRSLLPSAAAIALALLFAGPAQATSNPIAIGSNTVGLPSQAAVSVDPTGTAYVVWDQPSSTVLSFCKLPVGTTACAPVSLAVPAGGTFFDPPAVLVSGTDVFVFEEVDGATNNNLNGIDEWISADGGSTFVNIGHAVGYTAVGDSQGTGPQLVSALPGGNFGIGDVVAAGNPTFQANGPIVAPNDYSVGAGHGPFATLNPGYTIGNLGGEFLSQLSGKMGVLGVFQILEVGPCPSSEGIVFSFAGLPASNSQLNTSPGFGSPWSAPAGVTCNATNPALTSGLNGLGMMSTDDASLSAETVQYRAFSPPSTWGAPITIAHTAANDPSLSQNGAGAMYGTYVNDGGVRLVYSANGGVSWSGPGTLFPVKNNTVPGGLTSAVGTGGQGWAVYAFQGTEYAQPFVKGDAFAPAISHLKLKPKKFTPQSKGGSIVKKLKKHTGTTVHYADTQAAKTSFKVFLLEKGYRHGKGACKALGKLKKRPKHTHPCTATKSKGGFSHQDVIGSNSFRFSGRVHGHTLAAGKYKLQATPSLGGLTGAPVSAKFAIN